MLLIKCSCKCHSTLDSDFFSKQQVYKCPNCSKRLEVNNWTEIATIDEVLKKSEFQLLSIPDNTSIDFKFNIN